MKKTNSKTQINDGKLKPLSPTLRLKKRFLKIEIISNEKFNFKSLSENLNEQIINLIGTIDYGKAGIWLLRDKFEEEKQTLIIKVGTKYKEKLIATLLLIQEIDNKKTKIEIKKISGTLKGLEK